MSLNSTLGMANDPHQQDHKLSFQKEEMDCQSRGGFRVNLTLGMAEDPHWHEHKFVCQKEELASS